MRYVIFSPETINLCSRWVNIIIIRKEVRKYDEGN
ncbi:hypothetical protein DJ90_5855 [Paenibacillus macerans]|uniref:Uncharacterized protein n=1 Tax=Paenibacillus macerans TaxID=44252 RepID=A0A090Y851_PAEMA|nr:hypothetical protein DJ90_5855 [Paenibacillus macerans]